MRTSFAQLGTPVRKVLPELRGPLPRLAAGFKGLDDDHTPAAARTSVPLVIFVTIFGIVALAARRGWVGYAEKPAGQCDIAGPIGIGEEAVVSKAVETVG